MLRLKSRGIFMLHGVKVCSHHMNWTKLSCNKSTQLHDAFIGHARRRRDLIDCSETRTVGAQPVLNTLQRWYSHWSSRTPVCELESSSCVANKPLSYRPNLTNSWTIFRFCVFFWPRYPITKAYTHTRIFKKCVSFKSGLGFSSRYPFALNPFLPHWVRKTKVSKYHEHVL